MTGMDAGGDAARWRQVRELFDAVCELPKAQWRQALEERCDAPALVDEVMQLLGAQTDALRRVSNRLDPT